MGKKIHRGLHISAKALIFGILTLGRLVLKRYTAIFLILIFLRDMACESCLNWQKMAKIVIFQLWRSKNRVKNQIIQNSRITFLKNHMEMLHAKFQTISTNIVASKFFSSNFFKHFFVQFGPLNLTFCLSNLENNNLSWKTYWKSKVYHLGYIHAKFQVSKTITLGDN